MPYIKESQRSELRKQLTGIVNRHTTSGDLNFILTTIIGEYIIKTGLHYNEINDVMGALQGCLLEFYRRVAIPYEDSKIAENGDVDVYHTIEAMLESLKD